MALLVATSADVERLMKNVFVLPNGCWLWLGARSRGKGNRLWYGSFPLRINGKWRTVRAHRFSSEVFNGHECPPGHDRDHNCTLSLCVHPGCIEVVPKKLNQERKMERKGRGAERYPCPQLAAVEVALAMFDARGEPPF